MDLLTDLKIDFLSYRYAAFSISLLLFVGSLSVIRLFGLNLGTDFVGGTQIQLKFQSSPQIDEIREKLTLIGLQHARIQWFGDLSNNEVLIRAGGGLEMDGGELTEGEESDGTDDIAQRMLQALRTESEKSAEADGRADLNLLGESEIRQLLVDLPGTPNIFEEHAATSNGDPASQLVSYRERNGGLIADYSDLHTAAGLSENAVQFLRDQTFLGEFAIRRIDTVGPEVGKDLRIKARRAIVWSLLGILIYIWIRFRLEYSIGAIVALAHDLVVTLGVLAFLQVSFTLPVVAALLTIVGYSLNDTIVVFDRIRENLRTLRREERAMVINRSINQTLSRTILTSLTTLTVVLCLFFLGGEVIHSFALALLIGVVVGTYSSIFIASPILLYWQQAARAMKTAQR